MFEAKKREKILRVVQELNDQHFAIESTAQVIKILAEKVNIDAKGSLVREIMKKKMGMSYRKIKPMSLHANS